MADSFPQRLEITIDRVRLRNYLRIKWLLAWIVLLTAVGACVGAARVSKSVEQQNLTVGQAAVILATAGGIGGVLGLGIGIALYLALSHWLAKRFADNLEVSVEGAFLRIRQQGLLLTDRKLHFRAIVDYAVVQGGLMRWFGIEALQMRTIGGGPTPFLTVEGVKNCLATRDLLSEIDQLRENA